MSRENHLEEHRDLLVNIYMRDTFINYVSHEAFTFPVATCIVLWATAG